MSSNNAVLNVNYHGFTFYCVVTVLLFNWYTVLYGNTNLGKGNIS